MKNDQFKDATECNDSVIGEWDLVDRDSFIDTMSSVANSVNVVTTSGETGKYGVTVSAATSVTADPPSLLVCVHELSQAASAILKNGVFALNVLSSNQQKMSELFAGRMTDAPLDRFSVGSWTELKTACPILRRAVAVFDCHVVNSYKQGSHYIFIGQVVATLKGVGDPLIYSRRAYTQLNKGDNLESN